MEPRAEWQQLLAGLLDGSTEQEANPRLQELLREHQEFQDEYLQYLQLHALLRWRAGRVVPHDHAHVASGGARMAGASGGGRPRGWFQRRGLAAASVLLVVGLGSLLLFRSHEAQAAPDVVEHLIDWSLDLAQAPSRDERTRIYTGQVEDIKATLAKTQLQPEDRELAETVLATSSWLIEHDDPMTQADRFGDIADKVVARLDAATAAHDEQRIVTLANAYGRLTDLGVDANLQQAVASGAAGVDHQQKLERVLRCRVNRAKRLADILERNPEPARRAIHHAMKNHARRSKKHHRSRD